VVSAISAAYLTVVVPLLDFLGMSEEINMILAASAAV